MAILNIHILVFKINLTKFNAKSQYIFNSEYNLLVLDFDTFNVVGSEKLLDVVDELTLTAAVASGKVVEGVVVLIDCMYVCGEYDVY